MAGDVQDRLHAAYSAIRGREQNRALAPVTLDHLLKEHIESIQGGDSRTLLAASGTRDKGNNRISKIDALDALKSDVEAVVRAIEKAGSDTTKLRLLGLDGSGQEST